MGLNFNADEIMVTGASGTRRVMDDNHIRQWWGETEESPPW